MDTIEAIRQRVSTRVYLDQGLDDDMSVKVNKAMASAVPLFKGSLQKMFLVDDPAQSRKLFTGMVGGYGKLVSASACLVAVSPDNRNDWINSGFMQEQVIIELTKLGLATCWVGGQVLFDGVSAKEMFCLTEDQTVTNLVALGHIKAHYLNSTVRALVGAKKRKPKSEIAFLRSWNNDSSEFLAKNPTIDLAVEMAILSPSSSNRQPARVVLDDARVDFFTAETSGTYAKMSLLDAGIFMSHFYLALTHKGLKPTTVFETQFPECGKGFSYAGTIRLS